MQQVETIVAPATPPGESALGVVRISGPRASVLAAELRGGRAPLPWRVWFGDYTSHTGERIDEAIFTFFRGPKSYTGEDVLEISSHGNPFIIKRIVEDLCVRGCRLAEPGEFSKRAFLNGRMDLTSAEAVMDVIRARSDRALEFALRQLDGELQKRMQAIVDRLLSICAGIEAYIDFPEEDLPEEDRMVRIKEMNTLCDELDRLRGSVRCRSIIHDGLHVVLIGEPNAGKSTLFNRLVGSDRAIVSEEPGTTRDFIEFVILLGPHRIRMVDTAGIREAPGLVERSGVQRTLEQATAADLVILVSDATQPSPTLPPEIVRRFGERDGIVVVNKSDLRTPNCESFRLAHCEVMAVSALTGAGVDVLLDRISERADVLTRSGSHDEGLSVNERHAAALVDAVSCLRRATGILGADGSLELAASELRGSMDAVGRIVGRIDNEAMLDRLFSQFCIGK